MGNLKEGSASYKVLQVIAGIAGTIVTVISIIVTIISIRQNAKIIKHQKSNRH